MSDIEADYSIIVCKNCGESKKRIRAGLYGNAKDQRWVDENGKQFNGKLCPQCHREKVAQRKRNNKNKA